LRKHRNDELLSVKAADLVKYVSASKMTYIVSSGALNSTHSLVNYVVLASVYTTIRMNI